MFPAERRLQKYGGVALSAAIQTILLCDQLRRHGRLPINENLWCCVATAVMNVERGGFMASEAEDVQRLLDALEELKLLLASSLTVTAQTKPRQYSVACVATALMAESLRILSDSFLAQRLRDVTTVRWTQHINKYRQKRNAFRLLTLSGVIRPATREVSCADGGRKG